MSFIKRPQGQPHIRTGSEEHHRTERTPVLDQGCRYKAKVPGLSELFSG